MRRFNPALAIVSLVLVAACGGETFNKSDRLRLQLNQDFERALKAEGSEQDRLFEKITEESRTVYSDEAGERPRSLLYFEEAKALSALAWNQLRTGNADEAAKNYERANKVLADGDRAYGEFVGKAVDDARESAKVLTILSAISTVANSVASGVGGTSRQSSAAIANTAAFNRNMAVYLQSHVQETFREAARFPTAPDVSVVRGRLPEADGRRMIVVPSSGPLMNHGKVLPDGCTGGLVGYRLFITNAHCVFNEDASAIPVSQIRIRFEGLTRIDSVRAEAVHVPPAYVPPVGKTAPLEEYSEDWAIIVLDRHPKGRGFYGVISNVDRLPEKLGPSRGNIFLGGYSGDLNDGRLLSLDWGCTMTLAKGLRQGFTNCRQAPGSSGSPILLTSTRYQGYYIVALHAWGSKGRTPENQTPGGGPLAGNFHAKVAELREEIGLPSGSYPEAASGVLTASADIPAFEFMEAHKCDFAGRFISSNGIHEARVMGAKLESKYTGVVAGWSIANEKLSVVPISGAKAGSLRRHPQSDFLFTGDAPDYKAIYSRVDVGECL